MSTVEEEDRIIRQADEIKSRIFNGAEVRWQSTPDAERQRPWPRCWNITCNRTLVCQADDGKKCEGWDW